MNTFILVAFILTIVGISTLYFNAQRMARGEPASGMMLTLVKYPLLLASAGFNGFFTYNVFSTFNQGVAIFAALVMGGVTLAEAFLVRLIIAAWRHRFTVIYRLAFLLAVPIFGYSLMAADSSFHAMLTKNESVHLATQLELSASNDRIQQAQWQARQAELDTKQENRLGAYYSESVTLANAHAAGTAANEKRLQAQLLRDQAPAINPNLLGFSLAASMVGLIVSLALEGAIIGVGFFEELFIRPTPLPALIQFMNKTLDWKLSTEHEKPLQVEISPAPSVISYAKQNTVVMNMPTLPAVGFGWQAHSPTRGLIAPVQDTHTPSLPMPARASTVHHAHPETAALPCVKTTSEPCAHGDARLADLIKSEPEGGDIATAPQAIQDRAFQDWLALIRTQTLTPTSRPTKQFISERKLAKGIKLIGAMAEDWLDRAYNLGALDDNPNCSEGKPRYILAGKASQ